MSKTNNTENNNRRDFLKKISISATPFLLPTIGVQAMSSSEITPIKKDQLKTTVNFVYDGMGFSPEEYIEKLQEINKSSKIDPDFYGNGGTTKLLETEFAKLTGKEKAIYLPTGTMANQIAVKLLNGQNTKVIVPENSHIYRDEADAAQSVHSKRLIGIAKDKPYFELNDLKHQIDYLSQNEVFKSGIGTVVIENPVRRAYGTAIPLQTIQEISSYCKEKGYKMHLDGARLHLATAYSGVSLAEYASHFDTVYISLYKYLNAAGGAILCGDASIIDQISHQIKIYGGTVYQTWSNTSVALHYLKSINKQWQLIKENGNKLIKKLNEIDGITVSNITNGTNIYTIELANFIDFKKLEELLYYKHAILIGNINKKRIIKLAVNESMLTRELSMLINSWKICVEQAKK